MYMNTTRIRVLLVRALLFGLFLSIVFLAVASKIASVHAATFDPLTAYVNVGEQGENVTRLQMFLAANQALYPEAKVTGYFGPLTEKAVMRFQMQYGIDPVGRVGPLTLAKINAIINAGGWNSSVADISGPWIYGVASSVSNNAVTLSWQTNELATAKVFYNTSNVMMNEGDINSVGFGATNGWVAASDGLARTNHQVIVTGLQPNTLYYYVIVTTDLAGNVSVWNPNTTIRTAL